MRDDVIAEDRRDSKLGRRSLVRTGVWAVPVVAVATAAPAFAACSGTANLSTSTGSGSKTANKTYTATVTLRDTGGTTVGLMVNATTTGSSISSITAPAWSTTGATAVAASQVSCNGNQQVTFTIKTGSNDSQTITLNFTTTNGGLYQLVFTG